MTAARELRSADDVAAWLACGLALRRVVDDGGAPARPMADDHVVGGVIVACANELAALPPPGVIADVAALLGGTRLPLPRPIAASEALRAAIRAYDDDVLARLVTNPRFDDVLAAYAHVAPGDRPAAVAIVVGAICERAAFAGQAVSPAALRRALARPRAEREMLARAELRGGAAADRLADAYDRLARQARQARALVDQRELFTIDNLSVLRDFGGRMTADHVAAAAEAFEAALPRRLPASARTRGARDSHLADESLYPAGGFAAITPGGSNASIENLVTSELVYMEDGPGPDVFTLRYVEGELLYYTRDDSVLRRQRRAIGFVLGADLDDARVKDRDLSWQRLILALGLVVAATRWLLDQLGDDALAIRIAFPAGVLGEEREIVRLLLGGEIKRGLVAVDEVAAGVALAEVAASGARALADAVTVAAGVAPDLPRGLRGRHVDVVGREAPWAEWCEAAEDLLRWLV